MPHIHAQIDFVVTCFIAREGKALLVDHKKLKTWLPIGGHIELHQTTDEAMEAEIKEECGIGVEFVEPPSLPTWPSGLKTEPPHNPRRLRTPWACEIHDFPSFPGHRHLAMVYFARGLSWDVELEAHAHNSIQWFGPRDLDYLKDEGKILDTIHWYAMHAILLVGH